MVGVKVKKNRKIVQKWIIVIENLWRQKYLRSRWRRMAEFTRNEKKAFLFDSPQEATYCLGVIGKTYPKMLMWVERIVLSNQSVEARRKNAFVRY